MDKINILGIEYKIIYEELEKKDGLYGKCDETVKEITLDTKIKTGENLTGCKDISKFNDKTIRHEIIHAIMYESGLDNFGNQIHKEEVVEWFAMQYPKMQKIFKKLNIEE